MFSQITRKHQALAEHRMLKQLRCTKTDSQIACPSCKISSPIYWLGQSTGCLACLHSQFYAACARCNKTKRVVEQRLNDSTIRLCLCCADECTLRCKFCDHAYPFQMMRPKHVGYACDLCIGVRQLPDETIVELIRHSIRFKACAECGKPTQNQHCAGHSHCDACNDNWIRIGDYAFVPYFLGIMHYGGIEAAMNAVNNINLTDMIKARCRPWVPPAPMVEIPSGFFALPRTLQ